MEKVPHYIADKLDTWVQGVEIRGLEEMRKIPGYHDEPLKGIRRGQRSLRLSRGYRAIYVLKKAEVEFISLEEVNKHDY